MFSCTKNRRTRVHSDVPQKRNEGTFTKTTLFESIFWDLDLGSKFLRQDSEMTLPRVSVSDLPFSLKKSWELVCLKTARSLLQNLPRRRSQNP